MKRSDHAAKRLRIIVRRPWIRRPKNLHPQHLTIAPIRVSQVYSVVSVILCGLSCPYVLFILSMPVRRVAATEPEG